jgi:hypothetical protein
MEATVAGYEVVGFAEKQTSKPDKFAGFTSPKYIPSPDEEMLIGLEEHNVVVSVRGNVPTDGKTFIQYGQNGARINDKTDDDPEMVGYAHFLGITEFVHPNFWLNSPGTNLSFYPMRDKICFALGKSGVFFLNGERIEQRPYSCWVVFRDEHGEWTYRPSNPC